MRTFCVPRVVSICLALVLAIGASSPSYADEVLDWNAVLRRAVVTAATPGALQPRIAAAMHVAMFEAYNSIERRFTSIHGGAAPRGASKRAAVVYAAYNTLLAFFPPRRLPLRMTSTRHSRASRPIPPSTTVRRSRAARVG